MSYPGWSCSRTYHVEPLFTCIGIEVDKARYFAWLEKQLKDGVTLSEYEGAEKLESFRR